MTKKLENEKKSKINKQKKDIQVKILHSSKMHFTWITIQRNMWSRQLYTTTITTNMLSWLWFEATTTNIYVYERTFRSFETMKVNYFDTFLFSIQFLRSFKLRAVQMLNVPLDTQITVMEMMANLLWGDLQKMFSSIIIKRKISSIYHLSSIH